MEFRLHKIFGRFSTENLSRHCQMVFPIPPWDPLDFFQLSVLNVRSPKGSSIGNWLPWRPEIQVYLHYFFSICSSGRLDCSFGNPAKNICVRSSKTIYIFYFFKIISLFKNYWKKQYFWKMLSLSKWPLQQNWWAVIIKVLLKNVVERFDSNSTHWFWRV